MAENELKNKTEGIMKYYKLIGKLKDEVSKADSMDQALKNGISTIADLCATDFAIAWYENKEEGCFRPYYWIGAQDFTSKSCKNGEGMIGKTFETQESVRFFDYKKGMDTSVDLIFEESEVTSVICVPFSSKTLDLGCIQFARKEGAFTEEDADTCEIFALFLGMTIDEEERFLPQKERGKILLSARNITREFVNGEFVTKVLKGVNLDVYEGEFLVVLGESGCGKSTFLNIIGGMDQATSGTFSFEGKEYSNATQEELTEYRRDNIGFIFQSYNLMPNLNAKQNLDLIAELVDDPMDSQEVLSLVGLGEKGRNFPSQLSGGQQQRISIARALVKKPKLIFADEPTAALDYSTSIEVLSVMEEIIKQGTTLVMVTHNEEITRMADRVVRMRNGMTHEVTINRNPGHATELVW